MNYRTSNPKYVTYNGDGSGRDHYIISSNGGLHEQRGFNRVAVPRSSQGSRALISVNLNAKHPTTIDYVPDGTGRDLYVIRY
jgi:hypothetical protein